MPELLAFNFTKVSQAPTTPGVYAWYGKLDSPLADYKRAVDADGKDAGEVRFRRLLAKHLERYQLSPLVMQSKGSFGACFDGELQDSTHAIVQNAVLGAELPADVDKYILEFSESLAEISATESYRHALVKFIESAYPAISAPIYIGVAKKNIRSRLKQHTMKYNQLTDYINKGKGSLEKLREYVDAEGSEFAHRAILSGFQPDHLFVYVLPLEGVLEGKIPDDIKEKIATVGEWLLNHWHRPFAGRR